jgi:hypothetical protein
MQKDQMNLRFTRCHPMAQMRRSLPLAIFGLLAGSSLAWEQGEPTSEGYTEEPIFWGRPNPTRDYDFGPVGVTGLVIDFSKGKVINSSLARRSRRSGSPASAPSPSREGIHNDCSAKRSPERKPPMAGWFSK